MKITLAQAINLLSTLRKKTDDLHAELLSIYIIEVPKGESYEPYKRTVEVVLKKLKKIQHDILEFKEIIQQEKYR